MVDSVEPLLPLEPVEPLLPLVELPDVLGSVDVLGVVPRSVDPLELPAVPAPLLPVDEPEGLPIPEPLDEPLVAPVPPYDGSLEPVVPPMLPDEEPVEPVVPPMLPDEEPVESMVPVAPVLPIDESPWVLLPEVVLAGSDAPLGRRPCDLLLLVLPCSFVFFSFLVVFFVAPCSTVCSVPLIDDEVPPAELPVVAAGEPADPPVVPAAELPAGSPVLVPGAPAAPLPIEPPVELLLGELPPDPPVEVLPVVPAVDGSVAEPVPIDVPEEPAPLPWAPAPPAPPAPEPAPAPAPCASALPESARHAAARIPMTFFIASFSLPVGRLGSRADAPSTE